MQFVYDNGFYKVARITGSQYNLLAIRLSTVEQEMEIEPLPVKEGQVARISEQQVLSQVKIGLDRVCKELGKKYFVAKIQFLPSDSPSPSIYEDLTVELIKNIDQGCIA